MSATPIILPAPEDDDVAVDVDCEPLGETGVDIARAIAAAVPFNGLADKIIDAVAENAVCRTYRAGQTVFSLGQYDGGEAFVVAEGAMRVSFIDAETGAIVVDDVDEKYPFAIDLTFSGKEKEIFARLSMTAEKDLSLIFIDAETLRALAGQKPSLMRNIANHFADELSARRFNALAVEVAPQQRVFSELLKFVERDGVAGLWRVPRMPKHRELADLADVDESVAAEAVAMLIQEGVAQRDYPGLVVNDMSRLNDLAG